MDVWSKKKRSEVMSKIRSKNTKPELILRKLLFSKGYRYRLYNKELPGKPDIILRKYKTVIFVHGCFWHFHNECREGRIPDSNSNFWKSKFSKNIARDKSNKQNLEANGWKVIIVWECEIEKQLELTFTKVINILSHDYK